MKKYIKEVIALLLGCICTLVAYAFFIDEEPEFTPITISFEFGNQKETNGVQFFWTEDSTQVFTPERTIETGKIRGTQQIELKISAKKIHMLRMDVGEAPGVVSINNLKVKGKNEVSIKYDDITKNDIDDFTNFLDFTTIRSDKPDPFILFNKPLQIDAQVNYTSIIRHLSIIFCLATALLYIIISFIRRKDLSWKRLYMICGFLVLAAATNIISDHITRKVSSKHHLPITIAFDAVTSKPVEFCIFYTTKDEDVYNELMCQKKEVKAGENHVEFSLQTPIIHNLRIDIGSYPGNVFMKNFCINGGKDNEMLNFDRTKKNDIETITVQNSDITINSNLPDPFIDFIDNVDILADSKYQLDTTIFTSLWLVMLAISFFIFLRIYNHISGKRIEDVALAALFIAVCITPSFFLSDRVISLSENRSLQKYPELSNESQGLNTNYSNEFENWYSDHFPLRDELVAYNNSVFQSGGKVQNNSIMEVEDGWLFSKTDNVIENFANINVIKPEEMEMIKNYIGSLDGWCKANNKKFYLLICPNKATIYGEYIKDIHKVNDDNDSDAMRVYRELKAMGINVVFSKDELMKHKSSTDLLYRKHDTHHSDMGGYYSYVSIMREIEKDFPVRAMPLDSIKKTKYKDVWYCDLEKFASGAVEKDNSVYTYLELDSPFIQGSGIGEDHTLFVNQKGTNSIYVLGDSFSVVLQKLFAMTFRQVNANRETQYFFSNEELANIVAQNDIVLMEVVERHLHNLAYQPSSSVLAPYLPK